MFAIILKCMNSFKLSRNERKELGRLLHNKVTRLRDEARSLNSAHISLAFTDLACPHQCRHCALSAPPMSESRPITVDTLNAAREAGFIKPFPPIMFSGGEPLAHPDIFQLLLQTRGGIPLSNGFPKSVSPQTRRHLIELRFPIRGVSFHTYDSNCGDSIGRDELLAYIFELPRPILHIMTHLGGELELISAWVKTLERIFYTPEMSASLRVGRVDMEKLFRLPILGHAALDFSFVTRAGRAERNNLNGFKLPSISPELFAEENYYMDSLHLLPDGSIISAFIGCYYWKLEPILGTVNDDPSKVLENLKHVLVAHFSGILGWSTQEWDNEIDLHVENAEMRVASFLFMHQSLREGKLDESLGILHGLAQKLKLPWTPSLVVLADASDLDVPNLVKTFSAIDFPYNLIRK